MAVWAIGDLHLSFNTPGKEMDLFGLEWVNHHEKIAQFWDTHVEANDLVLIPGDISWAMKMEGAMQDLAWVDARPGVKVLIRGNHDYWWESAAKVRKNLPQSLHIISNDAFYFNDIVVVGARLWDSPEYSFSEYIDVKEESKVSEEKKNAGENEKIFCRELNRLQMSIDTMQREAKVKIAMTHYPPIGADLKDSRASKLLENAGIHIAVFGHLHSLKKGAKLFGTKNNIRYLLTSCDWLHFTLLRIL